MMLHSIYDVQIIETEKLIQQSLIKHSWTKPESFKKRIVTQWSPKLHKNKNETLVILLHDL